MYIDVRVGKRGEVVIPAFIRKMLKLKPGEQLAVTAAENKIEFLLKRGDVVKTFLETANKANVKPEKMIYGDKLYEKEFGVLK